MESAHRPPTRYHTCAHNITSRASHTWDHHPPIYIYFMYLRNANTIYISLFFHVHFCSKNIFLVVHPHFTCERAVLCVCVLVGWRRAYPLWSRAILLSVCVCVCARCWEYCDICIHCVVFREQNLFYWVECRNEIISYIYTFVHHCVDSALRVSLGVHLMHGAQFRITQSSLNPRCHLSKFGIIWIYAN